MPRFIETHGDGDGFMHIRVGKRVFGFGFMHTLTQEDPQTLKEAFALVAKRNEMLVARMAEMQAKVLSEGPGTFEGPGGAHYVKHITDDGTPAYKCEEYPRCSCGEDEKREGRSHATKVHGETGKFN